MASTEPFTAHRGRGLDRSRLVDDLVDALAGGESELAEALARLASYLKIAPESLGRLIALEYATDGAGGGRL